MKKAGFDIMTASIGGTAAFLFGELGGLFYALVTVAVLDYITGVLEAATKRKLSSKIGFSGIAKKVFMFIIVMVANIIDAEVVGGGGVLRSAAVGFFIANESLSILENAGAMGIPLPKRLINALKQLNKEDCDDGEKNKR